jgi:hypothetical protein
VSLVVGLEVGLSAGLAVGLNPRQVTVSTDGPDGWYVPETAEEFAALGLNVPDFLYLLRETSGNLAPTIGSASVTFDVVGTGQLYQQSVTGWTRPFVGTDGATVGQAWQTTNAALDIGAGESYADIIYCAHTAATRTIIACQGANDRINSVVTTGVIRTVHNNVAADGAVGHGGLTAVHQLGWQRRADTDVSGTYTDLETILGTHNEVARTGQLRTFGPTGATTPIAARWCWRAIYKGANAEFDMAAALATLRGE